MAETAPRHARFDRDGLVAPVTLDDMTLAGRVAIVTGAAGGIGAATATTLARLGADLAVCDRDQDGLITTADAARGQGRRVHAVALDVRDADAVDAFMTEVETTFERVDVLVNNAGGTFFADFVEVSDKGEAALIAENFTQVTRLIRWAVPLMRRGGSIVNVTSIEAHQAAPGVAVYAAMKAAVANLTASLALELAPRRIRVNAVAPDAIPTGGEAQVREALLAGAATYDPTLVPPLGHLADPMAAAAVVAFLAGDMAAFVTGTTIHVDGGNHAAGGWRRVDGGSTLRHGGDDVPG